jgi:hypothetical protein
MDDFIQGGMPFLGKDPFSIWLSPCTLQVRDQKKEPVVEATDPSSD